MSKTRDPEAFRKEVMADPDAAAIAKSLNITLEEFAEQVVYFRMNPNAQPQLTVMKDDELKARGLLPDYEKMSRYVTEACAVANAGGATEFKDNPEEKVALMGEQPTEAVEKTDKALKEELDKQLRSVRGSKS